MLNLNLGEPLLFNKRKEINEKKKATIEQHFCHSTLVTRDGLEFAIRGNKRKILL